VKLLFVVESGTDVRLVEGLAARNELHVLARRVPGGRSVSQTPSPSLPIREGPASRLRFAALAAQTVLRSAGAFDHVLVQGYGVAALLVNLAARLRGIPATMLVCSPAEDYYRCRRSNPHADKPFRSAHNAALRFLAWCNARVGQRYVVLSDYLASAAAGHRQRLPVHVIPVYGVDTSQFRPATEPRAALRARLGLPADGALLFFSSRVAPEKDAGTLLRALGLLRAEGRQVWLLHRSGGYREFEALACRHAVDQWVLAAEAVHPERDLPALYQASDLCVQASRAEGLGFSPLEALACEVPVVASAVGGLRETIVDGNTGWTYQAGNAEELARAIGAALNDPVETRRRAVLGRGMVEEKFERRFVFEQLQRALESGGP
jgi:glycosyltransferase involved in cell wall biosynthesis